MKYSLVLSVILYICACFYIVFGACTIANNAKNKANRLFFLLASSLAIWSFSYSISNSAPTAEMSAFWRSFSVFGWGGFYNLLLHFVLVLTKIESRLNKLIILVKLYLPAAINIILFGPFGYLRDKQYVMVQTDYGWMNTAPTYGAEIWLDLHYIVFALATLIILIRWWRKIEPQTPAKRKANHFLISVVLLFFVEAAIDVLPDILNKKLFPKSGVVFLLIPTIMLYMVLKEFGLLIERRKGAYSPLDPQKGLVQNRVHLFKTVAVMFVIGGAVSFMMGYFGMKRALEYELLIATALLLLSMFLRLIPHITRKHTVQNNIFLTICVLGMSYYVLKDASEGALTVWAIYILFLLFTVVLNSKVHTYVLVAVSVAVQVVLLIIHPEISVTIDRREYVIRIAIIALSYYAIRYLTDEYSSKLQGYQRFAKEQEVLERISSGFISISRENAKEKIGVMFEMSAEIFKFDYAYIVEFSADYEDATIRHMYAKDIESKLPSLHSGMSFKTKFFPEIKPLIMHNNLLMCDDTASISVDESENQRSFFASRGINSFFALPIIVDEKLDAMFIVEYNEHIDTGLTDSRLYFLKIITNILGDAKKKTVYEEQLHHFAYFDKTTKLANRTMLEKSLEEIICKESEKVAILDIEIENLKLINDSFGHSVGEQIMVESAAILEKLFGDFCYISRSSEEEFVVVLPEVESKEQVEGYANRILDSFSYPIPTVTDIEALFVIISIGISMYPDDGRDADTLLKNANLAGYEAHSAKANVIFYTELPENHIAENTLLTNRLFRSLQNEEFFLEFQPQISCETGKTVGIEALLRWTINDNKRIPPNRFVPMLEQTGLMYDVGLWVLKQALEEHIRLVKGGFSPLRISVNLSIVQFIEENFIPDFAKIIEKSGVNPKYLELEITESLLPDNPEDVIEKLHKLKELGVSIAIDDFGKGYSSLSRLENVPFDRIKIDKDIVDRIDLELKKAPVLETIISLARTFRADITAEGVETKEQADFLRSLDCDEIQGYYFSKPLSTEALEIFLRAE